jgi:hypothetical protein
MLATRMIPADIMAEHRAAAAKIDAKPTSRAGAVVIVAIWLAITGLSGWLVWRFFASN